VLGVRMIFQTSSRMRVGGLIGPLRLALGCEELYSILGLNGSEELSRDTAQDEGLKFGDEGYDNDEECGSVMVRNKMSDRIRIKTRDM